MVSTFEFLAKTQCGIGKPETRIYTQFCMSTTLFHVSLGLFPELIVDTIWVVYVVWE
jgi:hypothetical protein